MTFATLSPMRIVSSDGAERNSRFGLVKEGPRSLYSPIIPRKGLSL